MRITATHASTRLIQEDHDRLSAVMQAMRYFVRATASGGKAPGCKVFRAMLLYISDYPEQVHHPKEEVLFDLLQQRTDSVDAAIAKLRSQHLGGEAMVRELEHQLTRYELDPDAGFGQFSTAVENYVKFSFDHMRLEEQDVLPAADRCLTAEDWNIVDSAFVARRDPLTGTAYSESFEKLFSLIVNITPAPIGVGPEI